MTIYQVENWKPGKDEAAYSAAANNSLKMNGKKKFTNTMKRFKSCLQQSWAPKKTPRREKQPGVSTPAAAHSPPGLGLAAFLQLGGGRGLRGSQGGGRKLRTGCGQAQWGMAAALHLPLRVRAGERPQHPERAARLYWRRRAGPAFKATGGLGRPLTRSHPGPSRPIPSPAAARRHGARGGEPGGGV